MQQQDPMSQRTGDLETDKELDEIKSEYDQALGQAQYWTNRIAELTGAFNHVSGRFFRRQAAANAQATPPGGEGVPEGQNQPAEPSSDDAALAAETGTSGADEKRR